MRYVLSACVVLSLTLMVRAQQLDRAAPLQSEKAGTQVLGHLQVFEVPTSKLRHLGSKVTRLIGEANANPSDGQFPVRAAPASYSIADNETLQLFDTLRKDNLLKVLAEPRLLTPSGQAIELRYGDEVSVPKRQLDGSWEIEPAPGKEVKVKPEILGDRVRLAVHIRLAKPIIPGYRQHGEEHRIRTWVTSFLYHKIPKRP